MVKKIFFLLIFVIKVGRIRVVYEIRPLLETRPLKKTGPELFKAGETVELKIQIQWPRGVRRYCEVRLLSLCVSFLLLLL